MQLNLFQQVFVSPSTLMEKNTLETGILGIVGEETESRAHGSIFSVKLLIVLRLEGTNSGISCGKTAAEPQKKKKSSLLLFWFHSKFNLH